VKAVVLLVLIVVAAPQAAFGQAGVISLYSEPNGVDCNITDIPGLIVVYVVHTNTTGATTARFSGPLPACWTSALFLAETPPCLDCLFGTIIDGITVFYGSCQSAPIVALIVNFFGMGLGESCCQYPILPDPTAASGQIEVTDCSGTVLFGNGGTAFINGNGSCVCAIPVEESTWGAIKALYAE
jgi:hypothetical protein